MSTISQVSQAIPDMRDTPFTIIVPDIQATNYPSGGQFVNDSGATRRSADAIFEVKTFTFCNTRYNHNNRNINPKPTCTRGSQ